MKILEFFQEDNGGLSSTRLLFIVWGLGGFIAWVVMSIKSTPLAFVSLPVEYIGIVLSLGGVKVIQKFGEKPADPTAPKP
jgi:hypothetical protein